MIRTGARDRQQCVAGGTGGKGRYALASSKADKARLLLVHNLNVLFDPVFL